MKQHLTLGSRNIAPTEPTLPNLMSAHPDVRLVDTVFPREFLDDRDLANLIAEHGRDYTLGQYLQMNWLEGFADESTGDVDAPGGHWYRVGHFIVQTNERGQVWYIQTEHYQASRAYFARVERSYNEWLDYNDGIPGVDH